MNCYNEDSVKTVLDTQIGVKMNMKKYIADKLILIILGIAFILYFSYTFKFIIALLLDIAIIVLWGLLCKDVLLLPLDVILGKKCKQVYFSSQADVVSYEFFKRYAVTWNFRFGEKDLIRLLYPISVTKEELSSIKKPLNDQKVIIEYYRFSKILLGWKSVETNDIV